MDAARRDGTPPRVGVRDILAVREIRVVVIAAVVGGGVLGTLGAVSFLRSGQIQLYAGGAITRAGPWPGVRAYEL